MGDDWDDNPTIDSSYYSNQNRPQSYQNNDSNTNYQPRRGRGGRGFNREGGGFRQFSNRNNDNRNGFQPRENNFGRGNNDSCEILKVPSKFVGRIIGRGGAKISDLQFESGARIQVTKETEGDSTIVKLFGENDAISKARELIADLTVEREHVEKNSYAQSTSQPVQEEKKDYADWGDFLKECEENEKAMWDSYAPIVKNFYVEHPEVSAMSEKEVAEFRVNNNNIVVDRTFKTGDSKPIPKPVITFEQAFHNYPEILEEIRKAGFEKPSPIQCQAWPVLLSGEDLIGIAQTGTGKTLAFLLPALIHIDGQTTPRNERGGPAVLVMAPTRELAMQIDKEVKKYEYKGITAVCVYGGGNRRDQVKIVTGGVDIVIATPGRLNDLVVAGHLNVKSITYVVLDEADRMLDMGFEPQIRKIMYAIRPTRQTVMTSATWPIGVRRLAQSYMVDPVQVYVGTLDLAAVHTVTQVIQMMPDNDEAKLESFMEFARNLGPDQKAIVFCGKKSRADDLSSDLTLAGISCQTIHGDREQCDREQALVDIADGTVQILIATDVASRGLDIEDITHVLNYDFPRNIEEYVHRVGRTGRAGRSGESISYFTRGDWAQAKELISILEEAQQFVPEEIYQMAERYEAWKQKKDAEGGFRRGGRGGGGGFRSGGSRGGGGGGRRW